MTPTGWQSFEGVKETNKSYTLTITLADGKDIECSGGHQLLVKLLLTDETGFVVADLLEPLKYSILTESQEYQQIVSIEKSSDSKLLYDLINVSNGYEYYTNGILSHNCAHIENLEELWLGLKPTLSTGGRAIMFSSPKGKNFFYQLWMGAETNEYEKDRVGLHCTSVGKNGFHGIKLPWTVHPERDDKWFEEESRAMSSQGIAQELLCSFESSALTFFSQADIDYVRNLSYPPIGYAGPNGKGNDMHIWKTPVPDHKYVIAADVARGDAEDYSTFHVFDTNDSEVVAEYMGRIAPDRFGEFLIEIGKKYNDALIVNEKNTVGIATAIKLRDSEYKNVYYDQDLAEKIISMTPDEKKDVLPGFTITSKNREPILENLEQVIRNHQIKIYSLRFVEQMETFIWNGKRGQALKKRHDDLILAMGIGLQVFTPSAAQQGYLGMMAANQNMANSLLAGMSRGFKDVDNKFQGKKLPAGINKNAVKFDSELKKEFWWMFR